MSTPTTAIIEDVCPYDCRLPVNLPDEFSMKHVRITIEVIEPNPVVEVAETEQAKEETEVEGIEFPISKRKIKT
jgi:hypothetical protein